MRPSGYSGIKRGETFTAFLARNQYLNLLRWTILQEAPVREEVTQILSAHDNVEMLQWLKEHNGLILGRMSVHAAIRSRAWRALLWLLDNGSPYYLKMACDIAEEGSLDTLKAVYDRGKFCSLDIWRGAGRGGNVEMFEWLSDKADQLWHHAYEGAAKNGRVDILTFLERHNIKWTYFSLESAITGGFIPVLEWFEAHGVKFGENDCTKAASSGKLEVLQWLRKRDVPWTMYVIIMALAEGHFSIAEWALENGCHYDKTQMNPVHFFKAFPNTEDWIRQHIL